MWPQVKLLASAVLAKVSVRATAATSAPIRCLFNDPSISLPMSQSWMIPVPRARLHTTPGWQIIECRAMRIQYLCLPLPEA